MNRFEASARGLFQALVVGVAMSGALSGCAAMHEARDCGVEGCVSDAQISSAVREQLHGRAPAVSPADVSVQTFRGTVYLSGHVLSGTQKQLIESIARATPGVHSISNGLLVDEETGA
jgi:osmotically-inducible protein OsmY